MNITVVNQYLTETGTPVSSDNLVAFWKLDESSGTRYDSFGSNDLTDNNTVGQATSLTGVPYSEAADFEKANSEYLTISDNDDVSVDGGSFSFSFWMKIESLTANTWVINKRGTKAQAIEEYQAYLSSSDGYLNFAIYGATGGWTSYVNSNADLDDSAWHHIAFGFDSGNQIWMVVDNGTKQTISTTETSTRGGDARMAIGSSAWGTPAFFYDGTVQALGLWKRTLSDAEIAALANAGDGFYDQF